MDVVIIPSRNSPLSKSKDEKTSAEKIAKIANGEAVYRCWAWTSHRTAFYYSLNANKLLTEVAHEHIYEKEGYYLVWSDTPIKLLEKHPHTVYLEFKSNNGIATKMVKFLPIQDN